MNNFLGDLRTVDFKSRVQKSFWILVSSQRNAKSGHSHRGQAYIENMQQVILSEYCMLENFKSNNFDTHSKQIQRAIRQHRIGSIPNLPQSFKLGTH